MFLKAFYNGGTELFMTYIITMKNKEYSPKYDLEITTFTSRFIKRLASKLYYHYYLFMAKPTTKDTQKIPKIWSIEVKGQTKKMGSS